MANVSLAKQVATLAAASVVEHAGFAGSAHGSDLWSCCPAQPLDEWEILVRLWLKGTAGVLAGVTILATPAVAGAAPGTDIARIERLKDQLPAGYEAQIVSKTTIASGAFDSAIKDALDNAEVTPPECQPAAHGGIPTMAGSTVDMVIAARDADQIVLAAVQTPAPMSTRSSDNGCEAFTMSVPGQFEGSGESVAAPQISGVRTRGVHTVIHITKPGGEQTEDMTMYVARIDSTHAVTAVGTAGVDNAALQQLFRTAVAAVKA
ncbi:DUF5642 family protein [Mycobacterium sp. NPDC050853]|uniref:DUF5642 family protein n=1 Tax=Mycobacterium sp. NPDC050853 TaxID=3155160 RepID=UPI003407B93D